MMTAVDRAGGGSSELQSMLGKGFRVAFSAHGILKNTGALYRIAGVRIRIGRPVPAECKTSEPGQPSVGMYAMPVMVVVLSKISAALAGAARSRAAAAPAKTT